MKNIYLQGIIFLFMLGIISSCQKEVLMEQNVPDQNVNVQSSTDQDLIFNALQEKSSIANQCSYSVFSFDIVNSAKVKLGEMKLTNVDSKLYLTFKSMNNWKFENLYVFAGEINNIPLISGNINLHEINFNYSFVKPAKLYSFSYNLSLMPSCFSIYVSGKLVDSHGNMQKFVVDGTQLAGTKYNILYNDYCLQTCN